MLSTPGCFNQWQFKAAVLLLFCLSTACRAAAVTTGTNPNNPTESSPQPTGEKSPLPATTEGQDYGDVQPPSTLSLMVTSTPPSTSTVPASPTISTAIFVPSATTGPIITFVPVAQDTWCIPWNAPAVMAPVSKVIDGTTIEVQLGGRTERITYSGLGLLDTSQDWQVWERMKEANRLLVEGKTVTLIGGGPGSLEDETKFRYVLADNIFVNLELIRNGYAAAQTTPPETSCDQVFRQAQLYSSTSQQGIWAHTPTPTRTQHPATTTPSKTGALAIVKVFARGTPWQEPDEYVEIVNMGTQPVQLEGWSIRDAENHAFIFPNFVLGAGQYCRVTTDVYLPENCGFSYFRPSPVWDNDSDCAYLQDSQGRSIDEYCY